MSLSPKKPNGFYVIAVRLRVRYTDGVCFGKEIDLAFNLADKFPTDKFSLDLRPIKSQQILSKNELPILGVDLV